MTDHELVVRSRAGDADAFGELVDRHRVTVYRAALAALQCPAEADDVTQEAFITAFWRLEGFRGDASFRTWMLTIAWRKALDRRRSLVRWIRSSGGRIGSRDSQPAARPSVALPWYRLRRAIRRPS